MSNSADISRRQQTAGSVLLCRLTKAAHVFICRHYSARSITIRVLIRQFGPPRAHIAWLVNTTKQDDKQLSSPAKRNTTDASVCALGSQVLISYFQPASSYRHNLQLHPVCKKNFGHVTQIQQSPTCVFCFLNMFVS